MTAPMDGRLGRRFAGHDERSRAFGICDVLTAVERKPTFWGFRRWTSAPLDQQAEGACTAFSLGHELAAGPVQVLGIGNRWARNMYRKIQATDRAMGNDWPDGASMLASAKTAKGEGLISGYRWAFGAGQVVDALCGAGPVWLGVNWFENSYTPAPDGLLDIGGRLAGGHAICAVGYDEHPNHGPVVALANTWGSSWGVRDRRLNLRGGVGYLRLQDLDTLLSQDGEAIIAADFLR